MVKRFGEQKTEIAPPMKIESLDIIFHLINLKANILSSSTSTKTQMSCGRSFVYYKDKAHKGKS